MKRIKDFKSLAAGKWRRVGVQGPHEELIELRHSNVASGDRIVAVTVEDRHASMVMDILGMQASVSITEAPLNVV